jgi:glycosyltransferase involved in cell wall biosynthesis
MILIISATFPPEPVVAASLSKDLAKALALNYSVTVITPRPSRPLGFLFREIAGDNSEFEHVVLDSFTCPESRTAGRIRESFSFGKYASDYIIKNREKIQCCYVSAWPLFAQYLIIKTLKRYSIPSIVHIQDIYPEAYSNKIPLLGNLIRFLLVPLDNYILKHSSEVVAISKNMCDTFIRTRRIPEAKIKIVQNWQNEDEFLKIDDSKVSDYEKKITGKPFIFMYMGNIGPVAGCDFIIRSFNSADIQGAKLILAGNGAAKNQCIRLAESYNNRDIEFWEVPSGHVPAVQKIANVMLLPVRSGSAMSSVPSKLPAYMFSKKPVIACVDPHSDTEMAVKEANCGWIVKPEDIDELARVMRLVSSTSKYVLIKYGENGFKYALNNYSIKNNLRKLISVVINKAGTENE